MFQEADVDHSGAIDFYGKYAYATFKKLSSFSFCYIASLYKFIAVMRHAKEFETSAQWDKIADKVNNKISLIHEKERARYRDQMLTERSAKRESSFTIVLNKKEG